MIRVDAEAADFADPLLMVLDADHSDKTARFRARRDPFGQFRHGFGDLGDPEAVERIEEISAADVANVEGRIVLRKTAAEQTLPVEGPADRAIGLFKRTDAV